jgi:hypothetical protein
MFYVFAVVTDRWGRSATVSRNISVIDVFAPNRYAGWYGNGVLTFQDRNGRNVTGTYSLGTRAWTFTGEITSPGELNLTSDDGTVSLAGPVVLNDQFPPSIKNGYFVDRRLRLTETRGPDSGKTFEMKFYDPY